MGIIIGLIVLWLVFTLLGFVIKGLIWLAILGVVLLLATIAYGFLKGTFNKARR
jgi:hypothetical protein